MIPYCLVVVHVQSSNPTISALNGWKAVMVNNPIKTVLFSWTGFLAYVERFQIQKSWFPTYKWIHTLWAGSYDRLGNEQVTLTQCANSFPCRMIHLLTDCTVVSTKLENNIANL